MDNIDTGQLAGATLDTGWLRDEAKVFPRCFVMKKNDGGNFDNVSPFVLFDQVRTVFGQIQDCRKTYEGLFFEVKDRVSARKIFETMTFLDQSVNVTVHRQMNLTKGVISHRQLLLCSSEEIINGLSGQGVVAARRIKRRNRDGQLIDTQAVVISFNNTKLPRDVKLGFHVVDVRPYIPDPMRCFHCQTYGHTAIRCQKKQKGEPATCICGLNRHEGSPCPAVVQCVNCKDNHHSNSKKCPIFVREAAVERIRTLERVAYPEARRRVQAVSATPARSFAAAAAGNLPPKQPNPIVSPPLDISALVAQLLPALQNALLPIIQEAVSQIVSNALRGMTTKPSVRSTSLESCSSGKRAAPSESDSSDKESNTNRQAQKGSKKSKKKTQSPRHRVPSVILKLDSSQKDGATWCASQASLPSEDVNSAHDKNKG